MKNLIERSVCLLLLTVGLFAINVSAATNSEELNKLFSAAIKAVGDEKEMAKVSSIEAMADCVGPKGKYTTEVLSLRNAKTNFKQVFTYRSPANLFVNKDIVWEKDDKTGEFRLASSIQRLLVQLHEYQLMAFDFQNMFSDFELLGKEDFEGRPSAKVRGKTTEGLPIFLFFDAKSALLSGYVFPVPGGSTVVKNVFTEWKKFGNFNLPSAVKAVDSVGVWTLRFHTVTFNKTAAQFFNVPPRIADFAELNRLHDQQKTAHLTYNAEMMVEMLADEVTEVNKGVVKYITKAKSLERFKSYFASFKFQRWEDIKQPLFYLSKDGTMANVLVQKSIRGTYKDEKGQEKVDDVEMAWLEVWEKRDGKWKIVIVVSTEKEAEKPVN